MENTHENNAEIQALKDKLTAIMLLESEKDYEKMDSSLVAECVDFLMELEGKEKLSKEEVERRVNAIPFRDEAEDTHPKFKTGIRAKRVAIIAAVLAALIAFFAVVAVSYGSVEDGIIGRFARYISEMIGGDRLEFNEIELIKSNESKRYSSAEELVRNENISVLFPTWLPEGNKIAYCWYIEDEISGKHYIFECENAEYSINVYPEKTIGNELKSENQIKQVGKLSVYIVKRDSSVQSVFENNGFYYSVSADTEENLLKIIENLKEIE